MLSSTISAPPVIEMAHKERGSEQYWERIDNIKIAGGEINRGEPGSSWRVLASTTQQEPRHNWEATTTGSLLKCKPGKLCFTEYHLLG